MTTPASAPAGPAVRSAAVRAAARPPATGTLSTATSGPGTAARPARSRPARPTAATDSPVAVTARACGCLLSRARAAPARAATRTATPEWTEDWVSAVTAPAAGDTVKPVTAQTTAKRAAV